MVLEKFGFTPTETRVYQELLRLGPSTGYVVARELGIARANVYQALEALHRRGAARKTATTPVQYIAVGPAALIRELDHSFRRDLSELEEVLHSLPLGTSGAAELEQLNTNDQILSRAASCVDTATDEVLAVVGPWCRALYPRFAAAAARRIQLRVLSLGEPAPDGATLRAVTDASLREYWGGMPVVVIAGRTRAVCGVMSDDPSGSGIATTMAGIIPFLRHLARREMAGAAGS